jgi:carotenoid cleavage dioxygenase
LKYDLHAGQVLRHTYIGGRRGGEAIFVPRRRSATGSTDSTGSTSDAASNAIASEVNAEDDGYLLVFTTHLETRSSDLYIIDAVTMGASPLAIISIGSRVPLGFHALWVDAEKYADGEQQEGGLLAEPPGVPPVERRPSRL